MQTSHYLSQRTNGIVHEFHKFRIRLTGGAFRNIWCNRISSPANLRRQIVLFRFGKITSNCINFFSQIHGLLPDDQFLKFELHCIFFSSSFVFFNSSDSSLRSPDFGLSSTCLSAWRRQMPRQMVQSRCILQSRRLLQHRLRDSYHYLPIQPKAGLCIQCHSKRG